MKTSQVIKQQWEAMLNRGIMPLFEIEIKGGDYLLVDLSIDDEGICFEFDQQGKVWFDGAIEGKNGYYCLPFDDCFDKLDHYIEMISENIYEGYLIPNNLLRECEE